MKKSILAITGICGGFLSSIFGGFDSLLIALLVFMSIDYITGLILGAVFHNSSKTESGCLQSNACFKGLCKKAVILLIVLVAFQLDNISGMNFARDATIIAFCVNEVISIVENSSLMGIPIPPVIMQCIDLLKQKEDK